MCFNHMVHLLCEFKHIKDKFLQLNSIGLLWFDPERQKPGDVCSIVYTFCSPCQVAHVYISCSGSNFSLD